MSSSERDPMSSSVIGIGGTPSGSGTGSGGAGGRAASVVAPGGGGGAGRATGGSFFAHAPAVTAISTSRTRAALRAAPVGIIASTPFPFPVSCCQFPSAAILSGPVRRVVVPHARDLADIPAVAPDREHLRAPGAR